jgi:ElaB/YqjD/DUF883 family membrane-anchored ribosome-binding protein
MERTPPHKENIMNVATEKLVADLRTLAGDAEELVKATAADTGDKIIKARGKLQQAVVDLKPRLSRAEAMIEDAARSAANSGDAYVHEKPWTAIGIAAGVGLLVGLLIGRH